MKNNKTVLYASLSLLILVLLGSGFFIFKQLTKAPAQKSEEEIKTELPQVDSSVVVDLKAKTDKKSVILTVSKIPNGTESIEYELSYTTDKGLPKGALGKIDLKGAQEISRDILLGTCSKNTCTYDTGVKSISLVLRFNSSDVISQYTKEYSLE